MRSPVLLALVLSLISPAVPLAGGGGNLELLQEASASPGMPAPRTNLTDQLKSLKVPGLAVGIIRNRQLVAVGTAGWADIEKKRPVKLDTVFAWASVSKTVTAIAAMILWEEGKFRLDDDINTFLRFSVRNPAFSTQAISFRHLMTHTSSIVDSAIYDASYTKGDASVALGKFVRGYVTPPGKKYYDKKYYNTKNFSGHRPGTNQQYSNVAIGLLGHLVELIAEKPFDKFCAQRIFSPLGMTETSFRLADLEKSNIATPYVRGSPIGHIGYPTYPDGLLRTSVPNLARILAMMAGGGQYDGRRLLKASTVKEILRVQYPEVDDTQGLVWYYDFDPKLIGHNGSDPGTSSLMFYDPKDGTGALLVANGDWNTRDEKSPAADALLKELMKEAKQLR